MRVKSQTTQRAPARPPTRRLGVFGGTFDPIHLAHLRCAEEARERLGLDQVLFIPAASPPHKPGRSGASPTDRLAMVRLAVAGHPEFRASTVEIDRPGRSYSVDTLRILRRRLSNTTQLFFLLGLDAFLEIGTWKEYRTLFTLTNLVVLSRPSRHLTSPRALLPVAVRSDFCYRASRTTLLHESGNRILFLSVTPLDISASDIRRRVQRGQSIRYLVPPTVERYLHRNGLYVRGSTAS